MSKQSIEDFRISIVAQLESFTKGLSYQQVEELIQDLELELDVLLDDLYDEKNTGGGSNP